MASSSGTSSGSSLMQNSGSEEDMQAMMDQRKRKRMISNRESARRSRMRKRKLVDDLTAQITQLRKENQQIISSMSISTQHYLNFEAENSILRAQVTELSHRLQSLNEITAVLHANNGLLGAENISSTFPEPAAVCFVNPLNNVYLNQQPIMANSVDMFQY